MATRKFSDTNSKNSSVGKTVFNTTRFVDVLVVAGGGAGHYNNSGGGGAGGLVLKFNHPLTIGTSYSVTVGSGGTGIAASTSVLTYSSAQTGQDSTFDTLTAKGGTGGTAWDSFQDASNGGSGGGGAAVWHSSKSVANRGGGTTQHTQSGDSGFFGFGNPGGKGARTDSDAGGGGGGGAGTPGKAAWQDLIDGAGRGRGGKGGEGLQIWGTWYASGGGGGGGGGGQGGPSGDPSRTVQGYGGSNTGPYIDGQHATANTGNGGGGGDNSNGGNGGSGIVIIRYPDSFAAITSSTGSPTATTSGGYRYYTFNGNGSITI